MANCPYCGKPTIMTNNDSAWCGCPGASEKRGRTVISELLDNFVKAHQSHFVLTKDLKRSILNLCGTEGNIEKGVLRLQMEYKTITREEAEKLVKEVQQEYIEHPERWDGME